MSILYKTMTVSQWQWVNDSESMTVGGLSQWQWANGSGPMTVSQWQGANSSEPMTVGQWQRADDSEPMTVSQWQRANDSEPMTVSRWQWANGSGPMTVSRWQRADDSEPMTVSRWQWADDSEPMSDSIRSWTFSNLVLYFSHGPWRRRRRRLQHQAAVRSHGVRREADADADADRGGATGLAGPQHRGAGAAARRVLRVSRAAARPRIGETLVRPRCVRLTWLMAGRSAHYHVTWTRIGETHASKLVRIRGTVANSRYRVWEPVAKLFLRWQISNVRLVALSP